MRAGDCSGDGAGDFWRWRWRYVSVHSGDFFFHSGDLSSGDYKKKNSKAVEEFLELRPLAPIQTNAMCVQKEVMHKVGFGCGASGQKNQRMLLIRELDRKRGSADLGSDESCQIVCCLSFLSCAWLFRTIRAKNPLQIVCFVESRVLSSCARRAEDFCSGSNHRRHLSYTQFTSYSSLRFPIEAEGPQTETSASLDTRTTSEHMTSVFKSLNLPAKQPALICWPIALPNPTFALPHGLHLRSVHDRG